MGSTLVVVPTTSWIDEVEVFSGTDVLVLEDVLMTGIAGAVFKRLRVNAALHPAMRSDFDRKRHAYLKAVLPEMIRGKKNTVVVGTHPTDVDLMDFETVAAVRVSDHGIRDLSKLVYGDPLTLQMEYHSVLRSIGDSVDVWFHVVHWRELTMLAVRQFPDRVGSEVVLSQVKQREVLSTVMSDQVDVSVWLEDELRLDVRIRKGFLIADYDYLTVIRPKWRDAVVRVMGAAPAIDQVFRLPWFVVDPASLHSLCYRTNAMGVPAVSMRGHSLVEFVRTKLASVFTTRELMGTWVGALLCDNVSAVDVHAVLGVEPLLSSVDNGVQQLLKHDHAIRVPIEYAWMYRAVPDVLLCEWTGARYMDGRPSMLNLPMGWASTLKLAEVYSEYKDTVGMQTEVVKFMQRLHTMAFLEPMVDSITRHAVAIQEHGPTCDLFDIDMTMMLPGYNYLHCFVASVRKLAVGQLGCDPSLSLMLNFAQRRSSTDGVVSLEELAAEASRSMIMSGRSLQREIGDMRVGQRLPSVVPGYCYECLFVTAHRARIRRLLGQYPTFQRVVDPKYATWWCHDALDSVYVVTGAYSPGYSGSGPVMHFTTKREGIVLRDYIEHMWSRTPKARQVMIDMRIGDDGTGVCYGMQLFVANIIAWTIIGVFVVGYLAYLLYQRCAGGGGGRYGGGYSRR